MRHQKAGSCALPIPMYAHSLSLGSGKALYGLGVCVSCRMVGRMWGKPEQDIWRKHEVLQRATNDSRNGLCAFRTNRHLPTGRFSRSYFVSSVLVGLRYIRGFKCCQSAFISALYIWSIFAHIIISY